MWQFLLIAVVVTLTPGPATALVLRIAARDGRRAAFGAIAGHSVAVAGWGALSALGVSSLILASQVAYNVLRFGGAAVLIYLGLRSLLHRDEAAPVRVPRLSGWRIGLLTSIANPKLAVFFIALFPQFLSPGQPILPAALAMAAAVMVFDACWFGLLAWGVDRAGTALRPRVRRAMERVTGVVLVTVGVRVAVDSR